MIPKLPGLAEVYRYLKLLETFLGINTHAVNSQSPP